MKKIFLLFIALMLAVPFAGASVDKTSKEYLQNKKHLAVMNPVAEAVAERVIRHSLKKETGAKFKVKFEGYTLGSMKKGVFKYLEITGKDVVLDDIPVPCVNLKSLSDYNYVDYTKDPIVFKSDMTYEYNVTLSSESLNEALKRSEYMVVINSVNKLAYPMFKIEKVSTKIVNGRLYIITEYNFPVSGVQRNRTFVASSNFKVLSGKINAVDIKFDSAYGRIPLNKIANLFNLLNPLEYTLGLIGEKDCNAKIENVKIVGDKVQINGKIFVEGDRA